jgi:Sec-independent protein translocase protein TatA
MRVARTPAFDLASEKIMMILAVAFAMIGRDELPLAVRTIGGVIRR